MESFNIAIDQSRIDDLKDRIRRTRWINRPAPPGWVSDMDIDYLKSLADYWASEYDWRKEEAYLNGFNQYKAKINGLDLHFLHETGTGSKRIPVLLLHGWANTYAMYLKMVERIKKEHAGLDLIVPSHPGFAFSGIPETPITSEFVAGIMHKLMHDVLGYDEYYVHGGDFGSFVGEKMALTYPQSVKGLHFTDIPYYHLYGANENMKPEEAEFIERINAWSYQDGAYAGIQGSKPKTLSTALADSPVGLAAWLLQLFNDFSDKNKSLEEKYDRGDLLTNISLYWFTDTLYSSMRIYSEDTNGFGEPFLEKSAAPAGFSFYPFDIMGIPPKDFVERFFSRVVHWTEQQAGGHFAAMENPASLQVDLVNFINAVEKPQP